MTAAESPSPRPSPGSGLPVVGQLSPLAAVSQDVVRERWRGQSRPEVAAVELARQTSAGAAIYGRIDPIDAKPDSVRANVIVADASSSRVLFGVVIRWPARDPDALARRIADYVRSTYAPRTLPR